jgi:putative hydrolase of the HAD superfamily
MDAILVSETEGLRKPNAALFVRGAKRLNVSPASCLFVGDNPVADILGAHAAGMHTAWFGRGLNWPISTDPNPEASISELREVIDIIRAAR